MLETILSLAGSATGGGILGLVGVGVKGWQESKTLKLKLAHEVNMRKADRADTLLEHKLRERELDQQYSIAELEADTEREVVAGQLQVASYNADKSSYGNVIVDTIRGIMRPIITTYLLILTTYIAVVLTGILGGLGSLEKSELFLLYSTIVNAVVFLTTTAVTWWFGSRPIAPSRSQI